MYIFAADKQVYKNLAGQNNNNQYICDKLYFGHAQNEQVPHVVVDDICCIPSKLKPQIIKTVASMYIFAADKQVYGNLPGHNDNNQCICVNPYSGHAQNEQVPHEVVDDI